MTNELFVKKRPLLRVNILLQLKCRCSEQTSQRPPSGLAAAQALYNLSKTECGQDTEEERTSVAGPDLQQVQIIIGPLIYTS